MEYVVKKYFKFFMRDEKTRPNNIASPQVVVVEHEGVCEEVSLLQGSFPPQPFILPLQAISEVYVKVIEEYSTYLLVIREYASTLLLFPKLSCL